MKPAKSQLETPKLELHTNKEMAKELGIDNSLKVENRRFEMDFVYQVKVYCGAIISVGVYLTFRILDIAGGMERPPAEIGSCSLPNSSRKETLGFYLTCWASWRGCHAGLVSGILHTNENSATLTGLSLTGLYSINPTNF